MGGRGRGREELNPELESAYQEYLRQCREAGEQQSVCQGCVTHSREPLPLIHAN